MVFMATALLLLMIHFYGIFYFKSFFLTTCYKIWLYFATLLHRTESELYTLRLFTEIHCAIFAITFLEKEVFNSTVFAKLLF